MYVNKYIHMYLCMLLPRKLMMVPLKNSGWIRLFFILSNGPRFWGNMLVFGGCISIYGIIHTCMICRFCMFYMYFLYLHLPTLPFTLDVSTLHLFDG